MRVSNGPCANAKEAPADAAPKLTISAPEPRRKSRREKPARANASRASDVILAMASPLRGRVPLDRTHHPRVHEAAAQHGRERLLNVGVGCLRVLIEERLRREDHAAQAEAALRRPLVDEGLLDRMRLLGRAQPFERD